MQRLSKVRRAFRPVAPAARFRAISRTDQNDRLRGGTVFSVAATAGAAGSLTSPSGGGFGQARHQTAPAAGRRGGGGRGCEYPDRSARQALHGICGFLTTLLVMGWPVLVIGLAIANPPPAGVFAYLTDPKDLELAFLRQTRLYFDLPPVRTESQCLAYPASDHISEDFRAPTGKGAVR